MVNTYVPLHIHSPIHSMPYTADNLQKTHIYVGFNVLPKDKVVTEPAIFQSEVNRSTSGPLHLLYNSVWTQMHCLKLL